LTLLLTRRMATKNKKNAEVRTALKEPACLILRNSSSQKYCPSFFN
jgi:hypothetical protein